MRDNSRIQRRRIAKMRKRRNRIRRITRYTILFMIVMMVSYMSYGIYKESNIRTINSNEEFEITENSNKVENIKIEKEEIYLVENLYLGYEVDSRLEIPKINLKTNVLAKYSTEGLKVCASKYYGPSANEVGNYCIAGHNEANMFNHLIDLKVGDTLFLTDNKNGSVSYQIYDMYKVKPQNTRPLSQATEGTREITLITCVNYSQNRLVVKAREI